MKRQKDCAVRAQSQDKRHYLASQNNFEQKHFSLKKLRRSNLNMANKLIPKVTRKEALERVSFLVAFGRNKFPEIVRIIVKTAVFRLFFSRRFQFYS